MPTNYQNYECYNYLFDKWGTIVCEYLVWLNVCTQF